MKIIKNNVKFITGFILGAIIFGGGVYAATLLDSNDVVYSPNSNDFNATTVKEALDEIYSEIDKIYKENPLIPTMTSNTTPSGVVSASSVYSNTYAPYKAFDGNLATGWYCAWLNTGNWLSYQFPNPVKANRVSIYIVDSGVYTTTFTVKIQASNDGSNWTDVSGDLVVEKTKTTSYFDLSTSAKYLYYRVYIVNGSSTAGYSNAIEGINVQLYGRK